ncbi:MAG: ATP-dependent Clp protease adaptor ClpS [Candidatus Hydrogenedentota bacterium]
MSDFEDENEGEVQTKPRNEVQRPKRYKVLLHNDHYTSMEFVIMILESIFRKSSTQSVEIMLNVHETGIGIAGVYTASIAETKIKIVHQAAEKQGFPLKCSMEPE